jgi:hypothetical protein
MKTLEEQLKARHMVGRVECQRSAIINSEGTAFRVVVPAALWGRYAQIVAAASAAGTVKAEDARRLFTEPTHQTQMSLGRALSVAGFTMKRV